MGASSKKQHDAEAGHVSAIIRADMFAAAAAARAAAAYDLQHQGQGRGMSITAGGVQLCILTKLAIVSATIRADDTIAPPDHRSLWSSAAFCGIFFYIIFYIFSLQQPAAFAVLYLLPFKLTKFIFTLTFFKEQLRRSSSSEAQWQCIRGGNLVVRPFSLAVDASRATFGARYSSKFQ
eukprot:SAG31_NODE_135_length_23206_cov_25.707967_23_plen_178_part_00